MESKKSKEISPKDDLDSGLDNTSDSGQSNDEDYLTVPSDYEDIITSDYESISSAENKFKTELIKKQTESCCSNQVIETKKLETYSQHKIDFQIDLGTTFNEEYKEVIEFYKGLVKSQLETVDFSISSSTKKPKWLNEEKFKRGQKFARDHLFCINFAEMLSLFVLFARKSSLGPLIFTGKSDSPFTAFNRYLNTVTKLLSWYRDDVWDEVECSGKKNLSIVRGMHKSVYQKLTESSKEDLKTKTTLGDPNTTALWCPLHNILKEDFRESLPLPMNELIEWSLNGKKVWVNQAEMSITQFGFVGLAVTYPEYFGIYLASDDDLDAFLHMWRGLGYLLGIKDEYNYCNADLTTVRKRTKFYLETVAKPSFRDVSCDWEHMCRCLTAGISYYLPQVNFESSLLYLCHILQINTPRLKKRIGFRSYVVFQVHRLVFYLMKYSRILQWLNCRLHGLIEKTQNAPPEILSKWESKEFPYMKQPGKCPIRGQLMVQDVI